MVSCIVGFLLAFAATSLLTPFVRNVATKAGVVDVPGGRHIHVRVTPRLGGVAVVCGFFVPLAVFAVLKTTAMRGFLVQHDLVLGLVIGSVLVATIGGVDDVRSLGPWAKLAAQAAAAVVAYMFGYRIEAINLPLLGDLDMGIFALPVTVFWFLAITNAINLIDGLDGLAAGVALFAAISNLVIAHLNGSGVVEMLSACLCGSLLGFLRYNFNPATIFLGDSGSMFLGFALAATALEGAATKSSTAIAILVPIIALGLPIVDTMLAMVRRTLTRRSIFAADRGHIHHRLLDLGITHRRVVLMLYGLSIALALAAMGIAFGRSWQVGAALVVVGVLVAVIVRPLRLRIQPSKGVRGERLTSLVRADIDTAVDKLRQVSTEVELEWIFAELRGRARIRAHYTPHNGQPERLVQPVSQGNRRSFPVAEGMLDVELDEELQDQLQDLARPLEDLRDACDAAVRRAESARQAAGGDPQTTNHGASVLDPMQRRA